MRLLPALAVIAVLVSCAPQGAQEPVYKRTFVAAGTYLEVTSPRKEAAAIAEGEFKRLEKLFNAYDTNSELSRINRSYSEPVAVSPEMIEVLQLSQQLYDITDGAFDVSRGRLYRFWKEKIAKGGLTASPPQEAIALLQESSGMEYIDVDTDKQTVRITREGLAIDLGGIAKGYMVDKTVERLREQGIDSALINAGGDLYALGKNADQPWRIGIRDPQARDRLITSRDIGDEAVATSGGYEQFFEIDGKRFSHIIDPRSGYPAASDILSATVIAESCALADALATASFVTGSSGIDALLERAGKAQAIIVREGSGEEITEVFGNAESDR